MDAYHLYQDIQDLWMKHADKNSGTKAGINTVRVCVWTSEGYKEVKQVKYNYDLKFVELELEE